MHVEDRFAAPNRLSHFIAAFKLTVDKIIDFRFYPIVLSHSMIGYWHRHVVRPSVCLSVTLCIVLSRLKIMAKLKPWRRFLDHSVKSKKIHNKNHKFKLLRLYFEESISLLNLLSYLLTYIQFFLCHMSKQRWYNITRNQLTQEFDNTY